MLFITFEKYICSFLFKTVATGSYRDLIAHAQKVAADRYAAGCSLSEVQTAFDVLEKPSGIR